MIKVGFLLPRSTVYPVIGFDFLDGVKSFLEKEGLTGEFDIKTDNIGFGLDEAEVYAKNEEMLLKENADLVVAFVDGRSAEMLQPLYTATGKILLLVNMGAHYAYEAATAPSTLHHTFDIAFSSRLTGKLAVREGHQQAVMVTSFYDGGYLQCHAMTSKYLNEGGQVVNNFITHFKKENFELNELESFLKTSAADTILCMASGDVSHLLYNKFAEFQQFKPVHYYVSPMMLDESLKDMLGDSFSIQHVKGFTSWNSSIDNKSNEQYKSHFNKMTTRPAGIFGMLGWETGIILQEIARLFANGTEGIAAAQQLKQTTLESPRGWLKFDDETNQTYSPSYLISCKDNFDLTIEDCLQNTLEERKAFIKEKPEGAASGWRNTYLCS
jgi:branched-chain amino acid transport system substrate-binding protein